MSVVAEQPNLLRASANFRRLWCARTISNLGDGIAFVALVLLVHQREDTGVAVGSLLLVQAVPRFLGPFSGAIADRVDQRGLMIACDVGNAAIFGAIALFSPSFPVLLALAAASSCCDTLFAPAGRSALPAIVGREELLEANAWLGTSFNLQLALGPMLGGALVAGLGTGGAFAANTVSFLLSATILARLPELYSAEHRERGGFFATGTAGLRFVWRTPAVRALVVALFLGVSFAAMDNVALVFLVRETLHGSALAYGVMAAAYGIGMIAASGGLSLRVVRPAAGTIFLTGWFLSGAGILLVGLAPVLVVTGLGQLLAGCGNGAENIGAETLIQRLVPRAVLGRTFGVVTTAAFGGSTVAYAVGGFLLDATSPRTVFVIGGSGVLCVALTLAVLARRPLLADAEAA
jgi:MFS family permease